MNFDAHILAWKKEKARAQSKAWRRLNSVWVKARDARARSRRNKERDAACKRVWNQKHKIRLAIAKKEYAKKNRAKIHQYKLRWKNEKRRKDPEYRILDNLRARLNNFLHGKGKSAPTKVLLGATLPEVKAHLENKFKPGMSWENYGLHGWHIDHEIPCSAFDAEDPEQQRRCFHYTNLQPLWWYENLAKGDKIIPEPRDGETVSRHVDYVESPGATPGPATNLTKG